MPKCMEMNKKDDICKLVDELYEDNERLRKQNHRLLILLLQYTTFEELNI